MVTHVHGHAVLEGDHRRVGSVTLQQFGLLGSKRRHAGHVLFHVGIEDASSHPFMGNDRGIKIRITRPMVTMGFGVDNVAQLTMLGDFRFQL